MDAQQYCDILDDGVVESFDKLEVPEEDRLFQQDNDPNTLPRRLSSGLKTITSKCLTGLPNSLTLTLLSTFGCISKGLCRSIQHHPRGCMNYRIEWRWNGMRLQQRHAKTS